jgi:hypothetical protein
MFFLASRVEPPLAGIRPSTGPEEECENMPRYPLLNSHQLVLSEESRTCQRKP